MKLVITSLVLGLLVVACSSSKLMMAPVGTWSYTVTGTPNGTYDGDFIVSLADGKYTAILKSKDGEIKINDPVYDKAAKKLTGNFMFDGNTLFFESITAGETMTGAISAGGSNFPFKATKKK